MDVNIWGRYISKYIDEETGEIIILQGDILLDTSENADKFKLMVEWNKDISIKKQIVWLKDIVNIDMKKVLDESRNGNVFTLGEFHRGIADDLIRKAASKGLKLFLG